MKKPISLLATSALIAGSFILAGCGGNGGSSVQLEKVTNFQINNETGEFSFTGVKVAKTYYVRVYNHKETKTGEDGKEVEIPLEDKVPVAARRIRFKADVTEYSGEVDFANLVAGNDYDAYVYTYVKNDAGDLEFVYTDPSAFVFKAHYSTPVLVNGNTYAIDNIEVGPTEMKITFGDDFLSDEYMERDPNYKFTLYDLNNTEKTSVTLKASDVVVEESEDSGSKGSKGPTETRSLVATFPGVYSLDQYKISAQILSTNSAAYYDSEVSEKVLLKDAFVEQGPGGGEQGGGEGQGGKDSGDQPGGEQSGEGPGGGEFQPGGDQSGEGPGGGGFQPGGDQSGEGPGGGGFPGGGR